MIPYGRQYLDEDDIRAVTEVLRSDWLTTGPKVAEFEQAVATFVGSAFGAAVSSGTAALHAAMYALGIGPGDEVIIPPMTFAATANCVVYQGGIPVFADVEPDTLLIDPLQVEKKITPNTRAIIGVDYAGQPCDWDALRAIAEKHNLVLVADGCHALGAEYKGKKVGSIADMTVFSFHPVKHITTGEGGMVTTNNHEWVDKIRTFRNHGITTDHRQREETGSWFYEMMDLGFNYRITDIQSTLGFSQLKKLPDFLRLRRQIAAHYDVAFTHMEGIEPITSRWDVKHAHHLYVVQICQNRDEIFKQLREQAIGVNVHYVPVHLHPFYRSRFKTNYGDCPVAEAAYQQIVSLPIFPGLTGEEIERITNSVSEITSRI